MVKIGDPQPGYGLNKFIVEFIDKETWGFSRCTYHACLFYWEISQYQEANTLRFSGFEL